MPDKLPAYFQNRTQQRVGVEEWLALLNHYSILLADPAQVFIGPKQQVGYDLSILPENRRYTPYQTRPVPSDGKTDFQRMMEWLLGSRFGVADSQCGRPQR